MRNTFIIEQARPRPTRRRRAFVDQCVSDGDTAVAVKFIRCHRASEKLRGRQEIDLLQDLNHPNVLSLLGAYEDEENFIQVLEFLR